MRPNKLNITKNEVIAILTQDDYYRRQKEWPLLTSSDFFNVKNHIKSNFCSRDMLQIGQHKKVDNFPSLVEVSNNINKYYPFTNEILNEFKGNLVACGGSISKVVNDCKEDFFKYSDIDFFFYDLDTHRANQMRIDIIKFMIKTWKSYVGREVIRFDSNQTFIKDVKFYVQRNEYVTTIHVEELCGHHDYPIVHMYQFIHRIYPNISSIIGGFDISACMVAYDGNEIYTTPLGAWSLTNRTIIVDTGRRSTSFEYRLGKYLKYGFNLVIPGLSDDIIQNELVKTYKDRAFYIFEDKIQKLAGENGYSINYGNDLHILEKIFVKYGNIQDQQKIEEYDEMAFNKIQQDKNILPFLILNICGMELDDVYVKQGTANFFIDYDGPNKCSNKEYYINKLSDYGNDEKILLRISDYAHNHMYYKHVPNANATRLRLDNLAGVVSMVYIDNHENIEEKLLNDINHPNLGINEFTTQFYADKVEKEIKSFRTCIEKGWHYHRRDLIKCFGEYTCNIIMGTKDNSIKFRDIMINKISKNAEICKNNLIGIKWITENPGRQWTSSINPIFKDPRDWYGKYYDSVLVGIPPEIETCLRLMRLEKTESLWCKSKLPQDLFDKILFHILKCYSDDAWSYI
jgi:hypothetical protein